MHARLIIAVFLVATPLMARTAWAGDLIVLTARGLETP